MMFHPSLHKILLIIQILAAFAYFALAIRLLRSGRFLSLPFFFGYSCLMILDLLWHPVTIREVIWIEPWLLCLRFCLVIEAACLIADKTDRNWRRWLLLFLLFFGIVGSTRVAGFYPLTDLADWYRTVRQTAHVGLAVICLSLWIFQAMDQDIKWDRIWLPHCRIVSAYMIARAAFSFAVKPGADVEYHHTVRIFALVCYSTLIAIWLWYDRRDLRAARAAAFRSL